MGLGKHIDGPLETRSGTLEVFPGLGGSGTRNKLVRDTTPEFSQLDEMIMRPELRRR